MNMVLWLDNVHRAWSKRDLPELERLIGDRPFGYDVQIINPRRKSFCAVLVKAKPVYETGDEM